MSAVTEKGLIQSTIKCRAWLLIIVKNKSFCVSMGVIHDRMRLDNHQFRLLSYRD